MIRSFRSEWLKLRRRATLLGGGTIIGFAILITVLTFANAATSPKQGPGQGLTVGQLAISDGLARTIARGATFTGTVALAVFAIAVAGEYAQGTLRNLLVPQPRRVRLLAGELLALAGFTTIALLGAELAATATALAIAPAATSPPPPGSPPTAWPHSAAGSAPCWPPPSAGACSARCRPCCCAHRWPRSVPGWPARSPFELLVNSAWDDSARWLPGQLLQTLAEGGAATVTYARAALLLAAYGALAMTVGTTLFARRDVAT
jgi:ABC-2 type transport system permease protein